MVFIGWVRDVKSSPLPIPNRAVNVECDSNPDRRWYLDWASPFIPGRVSFHDGVDATSLFQVQTKPHTEMFGAFCGYKSIKFGRDYYFGSLWFVIL
jgi:hypothetical protein